MFSSLFFPLSVDSQYEVLYMNYFTVETIASRWQYCSSIFRSAGKYQRREAESVSIVTLVKTHLFSQTLHTSTVLAHRLGARYKCTANMLLIHYVLGHRYHAAK